MKRATFEIRSWRLLIFGLSLILLSLTMPLFLRVDNFHVYDQLGLALHNEESVYVVSAAVRLLALNILRAYPHYLGAFCVADAVRQKTVGKVYRLVYLSLIAMIVVAVYWLIEALYGIRYDLGVPSTRRYVDVGEWGAAPLRFVVYGPCVNPAVRIDGNWYRVDVTVPDGGYLVVDPLATPRSVTLVAADGSTADAFAKARRGNGSGSGEYICQPASPGVHEVEWDRSFGFDLTWYEEEGEPPWS